MRLLSRAYARYAFRPIRQETFMKTTFARPFLFFISTGFIAGKDSWVRTKALPKEARN